MQDSTTRNRRRSLTNFLTSILVSLPFVNGAHVFDKKYTGVIFSPYVKYGEGSIFPARNSYTQNEVATMLQVVSTKFRNIATYGMGTTSEWSNWKTGAALGFTGVEAAKLNAKLNSKAINVALGVWQHGSENVLKNAIKTAFDVTQEANRIYPATVWGITLTSSYVTNPDSGGHVGALIDSARNISKTRNIPVKLGVRLHICDIFSARENIEYLHNLLRKLDYVLCFKMPPTESAVRGAESSVKDITDIMTGIRDSIRKAHPKIDVTFESGWPSAGKNKLGIPTSTKLMKAYWEGMSKWASGKKIPVGMLEAFDEPSKSADDPNHSDGPCGSEQYFGWWRRESNEMDSYIEKINEPEFKVCQPEDKSSTGFIVAITSGVVILIGSLIAIGVLYFRLQKAKGEKLTKEEIAEFEHGLLLNDEGSENEIALRLPYDRKFELDKTQFKIDKDAVLGSGAFGIVYKGKIEGKDEFVAFKTTKPSCPVENLKSLLSEIKLMIYIGQHENVVGLVAAFTGHIREGEVYIASEFCSLGSLEKFLRSSQHKYANVEAKIQDERSVLLQSHVNDERYVNTSHIEAQNIDSKSTPCVALSMKSFVKWSYHIANGMDYLSSKKVIHADLAARNVLIDDVGVAKITDFGLSRKMYAYTNYVKKKEEPLPWRWMAIESLRQLSFSTQSDVWSYGVTLWEIYSLGDVPYPGLAWDVDFVEKLNRGLRLKKPSETTPAIYSEMAKCWIKNPDERPTFKELANFFFQLSCRNDDVQYLSLK